MKVKAILVGAGQRGAQAYAEYAIEHPDELQFVGVAEPNEERRNAFSKRHQIPKEYVFEDWKPLFQKGKIADCVLICTQDQFHTEPVKEALKLGYHVLCEKPMSPNAAECIEMGEYADKYKRILTICHVLRYSPFYTKLKEVVDSKVIGDIVSIQHIECVGYWHQAHSFVRGNWRNTEESSPMILQKSCHDMDILSWLIESPCVAISSFGSLKHFKKEEAPERAGERCLDCKIEDTCPYSAKKIYCQDEEWYTDIIRKVVALEGTKEAVIEALEDGPYGRCVYRCDNDVVDNQVVNLQFENGVTVSFTMCAFTYEGSRIMNIMGTKGQILCDMEKSEIEIKDFLTGDKTTHLVKTGSSGHSGSDEKLVKEFLKTVRENDIHSLSNAQVSIESHLMAMAAEESRLTGKTIYMEEFKE